MYKYRYAALIAFAVISFALSLVFASCRGEAGIKPFDSIKKELLSLKSYQCDVIMDVTNNKSTMQYKMKHLYKSPDKYRIEVVEPEEGKGQITVFDGYTAYIYHPEVKAYLKHEGFMNTMNYEAFIGAFICHFKELEKAKVERHNTGSKAFYVLELGISGENKYMKKERLWIDAQSGKPEKIEILDKDGNTTVLVQFENLKINVNIEDELFMINR
ncbi:MAG: LolA family protein [Bacillota bacterium]